MKRNSNSRLIMRRRFVKDKLLVYLGTFTLPVLLVGIILLSGIYAQEQSAVYEKLQTSLALTSDHIASLYSDADALQMYTGSDERLAAFYKVFQSDQIDYDSANALRYLSAYMVSMERARTDLDSIYFYLDNPKKRTITSENFITTADRMADQKWRTILLTMKGNETLAVVREKPDPLLHRLPVFSVFRRYPNYRGGTVINYKLSEQIKKMQQMTFFEGQYLLLIDTKGNILLSNSAIDEREEARLLAQVQNQTKKHRLKLNGRTYLSDFAADPGNSFQMLTLVPYSVVNQTFFSNVSILFSAVLVITAASAYLAYDRAVRNYRQLYNIVDIFDRVEKNQELPATAKEPASLYHQILDNIIHTFLENNLLQKQLSERKYKQISAQLAALQYQINPHFLFNTLQAINFEIMSEANGNVRNSNLMLENLSDLLRYSLGTETEDVSIREEIAVCKKFIALQQMREEWHFTPEWEIDPGAEDCRIRRMLLQPLLENALSHGLKGKENGRLRVVIRLKNDALICKIIDNGRGISEEALSHLRQRLRTPEDQFAKRHIGLANVNQRLILAYGEDAGIRIASKEGMGTIQYFRIRLS